MWYWFSSIIETSDHTRKTRPLSVCLTFKCIHGLAPHYLSNDVTMHVDIHGFDTRSAENMDLYIPRFTKEIYKRSFLYKGSSLWNKLPPRVKEFTSLNDFKHNLRLLSGWIHSRVYSSFYMYAYTIHYLDDVILSILSKASPMYSYPEHISILLWYCCVYVWFIYVCV